MNVKDGTQLFRKRVHYRISSPNGKEYRALCWPEGMNPQLTDTPYGEAVRLSPLAAVAAANRDMDERTRND